MGRVQTIHSRPASAAPGVARHKEQANGTKPVYKVVMEEVTQKKKNLIILECSTTKPPPGYSFIAAGNPGLTLACKELARQRSQKIFVVSTTKHKETELSNQVHRAGYHFPKEIVRRACSNLGINFSDQEAILNQHLLWPKEDKNKSKPAPKGGPQAANKNGQAVKKTISQDDVDFEALQAIKDLFPAMPADDSRNIVRHAFDLKSKRVGALVDDLSLPRRVQLAVVAHIRHVYTDYDKLLKQVPYQSARSMIENKTLEKLAEWRGDEKGDPHAMEDILREVIVIPGDDDDDDDDDDEEPPKPGHVVRNPSVEWIPNPLSEQALPHHNAGDDYQAVPYRGRSIDSDEMRAATALGNGQYVFDHRRGERAGAHRIHAWEEARNRIRKQPSHGNTIHIPASRDIHSGQPRNETLSQPSMVLLKEAPRDNRPTRIYADTGRRSGPRIEEKPFVVTQYGGDLYRRDLVSRHNDEQAQTNNLARPSYMYEPVPEHFQRAHLEHTRAEHTNRQGAHPFPPDHRDRSAQGLQVQSPKEIVLPSIEPATPTSTRFANHRPYEDLDVIVLDSPAQNSKRRRLEHDLQSHRPPENQYPGPISQRERPRVSDRQPLDAHMSHLLSHKLGHHPDDAPGRPIPQNRPSQAMNSKVHEPSPRELVRSAFDHMPHSQSSHSYTQPCVDTNIPLSSLHAPSEFAHYSSAPSDDPRIISDSFGSRARLDEHRDYANAATQRDLQSENSQESTRFVKSRPSVQAKNAIAIQERYLQGPQSLHQLSRLHDSTENLAVKQSAPRQSEQTRGSRQLPLEATFRNIEPILGSRALKNSSHTVDNRRLFNESSWINNSTHSSFDAQGVSGTRLPLLKPTSIQLPHGGKRGSLDLPKVPLDHEGGLFSASKYKTDAKYADIVEGHGGRLYDRRTGREVVAIR